MDNIRLILRYAIPGWLAHVFYLGYEGLRCVARGVGAPTGCMAQDVPLKEPADVLVLLTLGLAIFGIAGIPIGYVIYQTYMAMFHRLPLPLSATARADRGYEALRLLPMATRQAIGDELRLFREADRDPCLVGHPIVEHALPAALRWLSLLGFQAIGRVADHYPAVVDDADRRHTANQFPRLNKADWERQRFRGCSDPRCPSVRAQSLMNWATATFVWFRVVRAKRLDIVEDRAAVLSDIFHSLGAARLAVATSWLVALAIGLYRGRFHIDGVTPLGEIGVVAGAVLLGSVAIAVFNSARTSTQFSLLDFYRNFITSFAPDVFH